jgi:hypothetical protein
MRGRKTGDLGILRFWGFGVLEFGSWILVAGFLTLLFGTYN